ncbi:unnamed protein product, partial [Prunus brigantina]
GGPSSALCLESPAYLLHHHHQNHNHDLGNILRQFPITRRPHFIDTRYERRGWDEGGDLLLTMVKG